jgi:hypothetical protein
MKATGFKKPINVPGGTRLAATSRTTAAAIRRRPAMESTRKRPTASAAMPRILARASSPCSGDATG